MQEKTEIERYTPQKFLRKASLFRKDSAGIQNIFCFCLFDCFAFRIKEEPFKEDSTRPSITLGFLPFLLRKTEKSSLSHRSPFSL
ncbi:hypothetical protein V512_006670 [Mesotoga sp. Brook.08.105.5.1]|nr:hypothetical protein V512_006670 [Mesotoga sp. Brook.08.105.5.1]